MRDPVSYDLGRYLNSIEEQEASGWRACIEAAQKDGHTQEQAENCDDGEHHCSECPWGNETL